MFGISTDIEVRVRRGCNAVMALLAVAAVVSLVIEYGLLRRPTWAPGTLLHGVQAAAVIGFALSRVLGLIVAARPLTELRQRWFEWLLIVAAAVLLVVEVRAGRPILVAGAAYVITLQVLLSVQVVVQIVRANISMAQRSWRPGTLMVLTFATVILLGAALLALPVASREGAVAYDHADKAALHVLRCLFTATSATCVTGLVVYDTGSEFTLFGQTVILAMIQLGGLGIMIFGTVFGMLLGRRLSLRESVVLQDAMSHNTLGQLASMVYFVVAATFVMEAIGAVLLYPMFAEAFADPFRRAFAAVFHSISAFCNAGFSLQSDSLVGFAQPAAGSPAWQVYGVFMPLIVLGGLGFPVLRDVAAACRLVPGRLLKRPRQQARVFSLHTRLVLSVSGLLIAGGALLLWLTELPTPPRPAPAERVRAAREARMDPADALFQSITARTAGFNTVHMDTDHRPATSHLVLCGLMFVGGSPASTAGGIKTVTFAVLVLAVWSTLRRRNAVEAFGRRVPEALVRRAAALAVLMLTLVSAGTLVLCLTERYPLTDVLFEVVSACGTVGLSTGITPQLTWIGQILIIVAMFVGRLGPLTLLIAVAGTDRRVPYEYPGEPVIIG